MASRGKGKTWSEDKWEVYKPKYKVIFPGKRTVYCGKHDLDLVSCHSKEISEGTSHKHRDNKKPPYKVTFPGHDLGLTKDPRLGVAAAKRKYIFDAHNINDDSDYSVSEDEDEYSESDEDEISKLSLEEGDNEDEDIGEHSGDETVIIMTPNMPTETIVYDEPPPSPKKRNLRNEDKFAKRMKDGFRQRYNNAVANEAITLMNRDCECAELAMKFYNEKHGTDYEIVETLGSYTAMYAGVWRHCNFRARLKSGRSSKPKLFFAELYRKEAYIFHVNVCTILDGPAPRPDIVRGCKICGRHLLHPVDGFKNGK